MIYAVCVHLLPINSPLVVPVCPNGPGRPIEPVEPGRPIVPREPVDPVRPVGPRKPVAPLGPVGPRDPKRNHKNAYLHKSNQIKIKLNFQHRHFVHDTLVLQNTNNHVCGTGMQNAKFISKFEYTYTIEYNTIILFIIDNKY